MTDNGKEPSKTTISDDALVVTGGGKLGHKQQASTQERAAEDVWLAEGPDTVIASVLREQYSWRQAFAQRAIGFRFHVQPETTQAEIGDALARRLHLRRDRIVLRDASHGVVPPHAMVGEGVVWTLTTASRSRPSTLGDPQRDRTPRRSSGGASSSTLGARAKPAASRSRPPSTPMATSAARSITQTEPFVQEHDGPSQQPPAPQVAGASSGGGDAEGLGQRSPAGTMDEGNQNSEQPHGGVQDDELQIVGQAQPAPLSPSQAFPPTIILRMPSVFATPPAAQRDWIRLGLHALPFVQVELEDGAWAEDYDGTLCVERLGRPITGPIQEGDRIAWAGGDVICEVRRISGGGRGRSTPPQEIKNEALQTYNQALDRLSRASPNTAKKFLLRAVLRAVPKLPKKVVKSSTDDDAWKAFHAAATSLGIAYEDQSQPSTVNEAMSGKGKASQTTTSMKSSGRRGGSEPRKVSYASAAGAKDRAKSVDAKPKISFKLLQDDWAVEVKDNVFPGVPAIVLSKNMEEANRMAKLYGGKMTGAVAIIAKNRVPAIPAERQKQIVTRMQELHNGQVARTIQVSAMLVQLGDTEVWPKQIRAMVSVPQIHASTVVVAVEILKAEAGQGWGLIEKGDIKSIKERMWNWLPKPEPEMSLFDVFSIRKEHDRVDFLMRVPEKMLLPLLEKSAQEGVYPRPRAPQLATFFIHWFPQQIGTLEYALQMKERHSQHVIGIAHKAGQYGLRTKVDKADDLRHAMGLSLRANYVMKGFPVDTTLEYVLKVLESLEWDAVPIQDPKRIRRSMSEWFLHARSPPHDNLYHIDAQEAKLQLEIVPVGSKKELPKAPPPKKKESSSWTSSSKPGVFQVESEEAPGPEIFWEQESNEGDGQNDDDMHHPNTTDSDDDESATFEMSDFSGRSHSQSASIGGPSLVGSSSAPKRARGEHKRVLEAPATLVDQESRDAIKHLETSMNEIQMALGMMMQQMAELTKQRSSAEGSVS